MGLVIAVRIAHNGEYLEPGDPIPDGVDVDRLVRHGYATEKGKRQPASAKEVEQEVNEAAGAQVEADEAKAAAKDEAADLDKFTVKQLRGFASDENIDLHGAKSKKQVIAALVKGRAEA